LKFAITNDQSKYVPGKIINGFRNDRVIFGELFGELIVLCAV
jgi:hypothetical protein